MADGVAAPDATVSATAHATPGAILGVVIDASQLPVARATVTAVSADGASFRAVLTGIDGSYALSDLPAGSWSITAQIDGAAPVTVQQVVVETRTAKRFDIVMNGVAPALAPNAVQSARHPEPPPRPPPPRRRRRCRRRCRPLSPRPRWTTTRRLHSAISPG